jgi:hypothetical protein
MQSKDAFSKQSKTVPYVPIPRDFITLTRQPAENPDIIDDVSLAYTKTGLGSVCKKDVPDKQKHVCFEYESNRITRHNNKICNS